MTKYFGGRPNKGRFDGSQGIIFLGLFFLGSLSLLAVLFLTSSEEPGQQAAAVVVKEQPPALQEVEVLVPFKDIPAGQQLQSAMFRIELRPALSINERTVRSAEQIQGYFSRTMIVGRQPFSFEHVSNVRPISAISSNIPVGFRAVTIRVNDTAGVGGWILPGGRVDVYWASKVRGRSAVSLLIQNARVLSLNRQVNSNIAAQQPSTVTLLVAAPDAKKIHLARQSGSLSLSLRGDADPGEASQGGTIDTNALLGRSASSSSVRRESKGVVTFGGIKYLVDANGELTRVTN